MSLFASSKRLLSTIAGMLFTRLSLIRVELEEEMLRLAAYGVSFLLILFCMGMALFIGLILVVIYLPQAYQIPILLGLFCLFMICGIGMSWRLYAQLAHKPRLLEASMAEIKKDLALFLGTAPEHTPSAQHPQQDPSARPNNSLSQ